MRQWLLTLLPVALLTLALVGCDKERAEDDDAPPAPKAAPQIHTAQKVEDPRLEHSYRISDKVYTGAQPKDADSFKALKELGIKTIISVDGTKPDLEAAKRAGLRYVHLPIGYDGVPAARAKELALAVEDLDGPVYIHCHHGMHRGPAAAAAACVISGQLSNEEALASMKVLGTGENYLGLWASVRSAQRIDDRELKKVKVEFKELSPIPPLADAMVVVDELSDNLKDAQKAGWTAPKDHPDIDLAHEALKLKEIYVELQRTEDFKARPADFKKWMGDAEQHTTQLEANLRDLAKAPDDAVLKERATASYKLLSTDCMSCHKVYRNAPH